HRAYEERGRHYVRDDVGKLVQVHGSQAAFSSVGKGGPTAEASKCYRYSELDARAKTIAEILHSGDQYLIPFFPRSYSWESKHWQRILAGVDALAETAADRLHFLDPLVCTPTIHVPSSASTARPS